MAITSTVTPAVELTRLTSINHLDDAGSPSDASYTVGFAPRYVRVENTTDRIAFEWFSGMTSTHCVKTVAAGTRTLETSGGVTVSGATIGWPVIQNKQYRVIVMG
ncbi:hypothetical protein [Caudoviricetes sp.]|nr:hypothetical protein [Caudoviricetes sp.]